MCEGWVGGDGVRDGDRDGWRWMEGEGDGDGLQGWLAGWDDAVLRVGAYLRCGIQRGRVWVWYERVRCKAWLV